MHFLFLFSSLNSNSEHIHTRTCITHITYRTEWKLLNKRKPHSQTHIFKIDEVILLMNKQIIIVTTYLETQRHFHSNRGECLHLCIYWNKCSSSFFVYQQLEHIGIFSFECEFIFIVKPNHFPLKTSISFVEFFHIKLFTKRSISGSFGQVKLYWFMV